MICNIKLISVWKNEVKQAEEHAHSTIDVWRANQRANEI